MDSFRGINIKLYSYSPSQTNYTITRSLLTVGPSTDNTFTAWEGDKTYFSYEYPAITGSTSCNVSVTEADGRISGTFSCTGLIRTVSSPASTTQGISLTDGKYNCKLQ